MKALAARLLKSPPDAPNWLPPWVEVDAIHKGLRYEFAVAFTHRGQIDCANKTAPVEDFYVGEKIPPEIRRAAMIAYLDQN
jgi:hypothetical protein